MASDSKGFAIAGAKFNIPPAQQAAFRARVFALKIEKIGASFTTHLTPED